MAKGTIHTSKMTIPNIGFSYTGRYDADTGGRSGRHANPTKDRVARSIRKAQRREGNRLTVA